MILLIPAFFGCLLFVTLLWGIGERLKNASIIDAAWSLMIGVPGFFYAFATPEWPVRKILMLIMVGAWALRLALHIGARQLHEKKEDPRYTRMRQQWGPAQGVKMLRFFWIQAAAAVFFSVPFLVVSLNPSSELHWLEGLGFSIAMIALAGEWLADRQLAGFKRDSANRGKTCRAGLWNYSRHPNYFFEWLIWTAFFIFSLGSPYGIFTVIFPILIFHLLRNVTGVPMAEKQALASRGDVYRKYQEEVNAFFPWFPKERK